VGDNPNPDTQATEPLGSTHFATNLILEGGYIRSSNYVADSAGWAIDFDGNAEFNNVVARGILIGSTFVSQDGDNLVPNPDMATDATGWTDITNCAISRITSFSHAETATTTALRIDADAAGECVVESDFIDLSDTPEGIAFGIGANAEVTAGALASPSSIYVYIDWYDVDDALISSSGETARLLTGAEYTITMPGSSAPHYRPDTSTQCKVRILVDEAAAGSCVVDITDITINRIGSVAARVGIFERLFVENPGSGVTTLTVDGGDTDSTPLNLSAEVTTMTLNLVNRKAVSTSNQIRLDFTANTSAQARTTLRIATDFSTTNDATRTSRIVMSTADGGTFSDIMAFVGSDVGIGTLVPNARAHIRGDDLASVAAPSVIVATTATGDDVQQLIVQARATTSDATVTTLAALGLGNIPNMASSNLAVQFVAFITARNSSSISGSAGYMITGACYLSAGTATMLGTPTVLAYEGDAAFDATANCSSGNLRLRVTGKAATDVVWHATIMLFPASA
jgi:hypothetical protein